MDRSNNAMSKEAHDQTGDSNRRQERHDVRVEARIESLEPSEDGSVRVETVQITDISTGGVGFVAQNKIESGSTWSLRDVPQAGMSFSESIVIRWTAPLDDGKYNCGAQYMSGLNLFAKSGVGLDKLVNDLNSSPEKTSVVSKMGFAESDEAITFGNMNNLEFHARGHLTVKGSINNCRIDASNGIAIPNGTIIGGRTQVSGQLAVASLGSPDADTTELFIGGKSEVDELLSRVPEHIATLDDKIGEMEKEIMMIEAVGNDATHSQRERHMSILYEMPDMQSQKERLLEKAEKLREIQSQQQQTEVLIDKTLYPGVVFCMSGRRYEITQEISGPINISYRAGIGLVIQTINDEAPADMAAQGYVNHTS